MEIIYVFIIDYSWHNNQMPTDKTLFVRDHENWKLSRNMSASFFMKKIGACLSILMPVYSNYLIYSYAAHLTHKATDVSNCFHQDATVSDHFANQLLF